MRSTEGVQRTEPYQQDLADLTALQTAHDRSRGLMLMHALDEVGAARWLPGSYHSMYHASLAVLVKAYGTFVTTYGFEPQLD